MVLIQDILDNQSLTIDSINAGSYGIAFGIKYKSESYILKITFIGFIGPRTQNIKINYNKDTETFVITTSNTVENEIRILHDFNKNNNKFDLSPILYDTKTIEKEEINTFLQNVTRGKLSISISKEELKK
jgi:hypothetical protein